MPHGDRVMQTRIERMPLRWMQFVDGENLTIRAQVLFRDMGLNLEENAFYRKDSVLLPNPQFWSNFNWMEPTAVRSFYYTSIIGDDILIQGVRRQLWDCGHEPHVFKRIRGETKAKGVDIALTKDMLSHAFRENYDTAVLVAGDGDYVPLIEEVKRLGKQVIVAFIGGVTNENLRLASDRFNDIGDVLVGWAKGQIDEQQAERERRAARSGNA